MISKDSISICVPITKETFEEIQDEINRCKEKGVKLIEYRRDYLKDGEDEDKVYELLHDNLDNFDIILTFRKKDEGGKTDVEDSKRFESIKKALEKECVTYIDMEEKSVKDFLGAPGSTLLDKAGLIVSAHYFDQTPEDTQIIEQLKRSNEYGDVIKIATMINTEKDLKRLKRIIGDFSNRTQKPLIVVGMGKPGEETRRDPASYCSNVTFAPLESKSASAPGQVDYDEIKKSLNNEKETYIYNWTDGFGKNNNR